MNRRVIQLLIILGMVAAMPRAPAQLPARAADRGTSAARATAPPLPNAPDSRGDDPLPRGCGGVTGPGEAACCVSGFVYADGQPVAGAEVEIQNHDGVTVTMVTQLYSGTETPYYQLSLSAPPLNVQAGELITVTARYGGAAHSLRYRVQPGGQHADVVLPHSYSEGYVYERQIWGQAEPRQFNDPRGLAVDGAGNIYVVDRGNARVQVFGPDKEFIRQWGTLGNLPGQFLHPIGIAVDNGGTVYVADTDNHRIQEFSSTGRFIAAWGGFGRADGQFIWPEGVAVDARGNVYVADKGNDRIQKFSSGRAWLETKHVEHLEPIDVSVDPAGNIYVVGPGHIYEFDSGGVQRALWEGSFNADDPNNADEPGGISADGEAVYVTAGSHIYMFDTALQPNGTRSVSPAGFKRGGDIAIDSRGHLYATDTLNHSILKLDTSGNKIGSWGNYGRANGELSKPKGVAVDGDGKVYVADTQNDRIQVFSSGGAWLETWYGTPAGEFLKPSEITIDHYGMGQGSNETAAIAAYRWTLGRDHVLGTAPALDISATDLSPGAHRLSFAVKDKGEWSDAIGADITVAAPPVAEWTMLLYLVGDYDDRGRLLNDFNQLLDALRGSFRNPYLRIAVQLDGPDDGDTRRLLIAPGSLTDSPQITEMPHDERAMDKPAELANFVRWGKDKFPAEHYYLAIADHGQGIQGLAWDTTSDPTGGAFLTVKELGEALNEPGVGPIDVLHLDACTMDLLEVAYEVNSQQDQRVGILIASQYLGWDYFAYDAYQGLIGAATSPRELAQGITARYATLAHADGHPYTIAALDLRRMHPARAALDALAEELIGQMNAHQLSTTTLDAILQASQHFDSNGNYRNDEQDMYVDLVDWAQRIHDGVSIPAVQEMADALRAALIGSEPLIIASQAESNPLPPQYAGGANVDLAGSKGVSIFYPQRQDTAAFQSYVTNQLFSFTSVSHWPEFLVAGGGVPCSGCTEPPPGPLPPLSQQRQVFLPIGLR